MWLSNPLPVLGKLGTPYCLILGLLAVVGDLFLLSLARGGAEMSVLLAITAGVFLQPGYT